MPLELSQSEIDRYQRQISIEEIGRAGQEKIKKARICICGAGGLGSPSAIYLSAAGIGSLTLIDHDRVSLNNLNRQILHSEEKIGRYKVDSAKAYLSHLNSGTDVTALREKITAVNAEKLITGHDVVIDALDNLDARYLINEAVQKTKTVLIHGAVDRFEGRIMTIVPGKTACLRCLYRGPVKPSGSIPVIGVAPAVIGALQAAEAIKYILGTGRLLTDTMLIYNGLDMKFQEMRLKKNPNCDHCGK